VKVGKILEPLERGSLNLDDLKRVVNILAGAIFWNVDIADFVVYIFTIIKVKYHTVLD
jgi:hypothetical protein